MADFDTRPSRVTHGAVHVLAYLDETDASCNEGARQTSLSESSTYRWLTELGEAGILRADAIRTDTGRSGPTSTAATLTSSMVIIAVK